MANLAVAPPSGSPEVHCTDPVDATAAPGKALEDRMN